MSELDKHGRMWKLKEWIDDEEKVRWSSIMIEGVRFMRYDEREWSVAMREAAGQRWTRRWGWE